MTANSELAALLRGRGNLLVNESSWALAPAAIKAGRPAALILDETRWDPDVVEPLKSAIASVREPYLPVLARASPLGGPVFGGALPIAASASPERVLARLNWVLRLRALHAAILYHLASSGSSACGDRINPSGRTFRPRNRARHRPRPQLSRACRRNRRARAPYQYAEHRERGPLSLRDEISTAS